MKKLITTLMLIVLCTAIAVPAMASFKSFVYVQNLTDSSKAHTGYVTIMDKNNDTW